MWPIVPLFLRVGYQMIYPQFFRKCECIKFKFRLHPSTFLAPAVTAKTAKPTPPPAKDSKLSSKQISPFLDKLQDCYSSSHTRSLSHPITQFYVLLYPPPPQYNIDNKLFLHIYLIMFYSVSSDISCKSTDLIKWFWIVAALTRHYVLRDLTLHLYTPTIIKRKRITICRFTARESHKQTDMI